MTLLGVDTPVSDERARTINTLREIAQALNSEQQAQAAEILETVGPEPENGRPSAAQLSGVALYSLDTWYAAEQLHNGIVRVPQRDTPRSIRNLTPAIEALAGKGRALRSADSLLQRNPAHDVAGAGAYMVAAALTAVAARRETTFEDVLDELLPAQEVSEPVTPAQPAAPAAPAAQEPAAPKDVVDVVDETAAPAEASQDDPKARYTAIVETRFMAGIKEFAQWMGESHPVTGTGLPKRADIKDVAATIGIDAEGVAKKPDPVEPAASDLDLNVPAESQPTRFATSAQAIPELMAFWNTLQEAEVVEVLSTKIQPGANTLEFGFEDFDKLDAAEQLVATYVHQTLTHDADDAAATTTAQFLLDPAAVEDTDAILIPRLRQLEALDLVDIVDGKPAIAAPLRTAVVKGATAAAA